MSIFSEVKEQVSTRDTAKFYGYKVSRNGMMCCPFHEDKHPSMKVDKNFICFGCQEKGDVIRFASLLFGLPPYEAAGKLAADMGLNISDAMRSGADRSGAKPGTAQRAKRKRTERQQFGQAVSRIYKVYCDYLHLLNEWAEAYAPRSPDEEFHPLFVEAMQKRDYVNYLLDLLFYGSEEDKAFVVIEYGKEVDALEKRIAEFKPEDREKAARGDVGSPAGTERAGSYGDAGSDGKGAGDQQRYERRYDPDL